MTPAQSAALAKQIARELGFTHCGISEARFLEEEAPRFEQWLKRNYQGKMSYLEANFDKRLDPTKLVPGARTVISLVYNYFPADKLRGELKIARYAYGEDYHLVLRKKLKVMMDRLREKIGTIDGRVFTDSAPVHERAWARQGGLGWVGKNSLLLNRQMGSFFFLAELIVDAQMEPDAPTGDYCGTCTACMDACPTEAIPEPYTVDGSRCISYLTIELKEEIPDAFKGKFDNWVFGCDICQEVCPWNRFSKPHTEPRFNPSGEMSAQAASNWSEITEEVFGAAFGKSPLKRTGFDGLMRNIVFATDGNNKAPGGA